MFIWSLVVFFFIIVVRGYRPPLLILLLNLQLNSRLLESDPFPSPMTSFEDAPSSDAKKT